MMHGQKNIKKGTNCVWIFISGILVFAQRI